jgi:SOS-response transcriptional repressor LexA
MGILAIESKRSASAVAVEGPFVAMAEEESDLPGDNAFALRIEGESMVDPTGPISFPLNAIIIVDPDRVAKAGDFVVVREVGVKNAFFRRLDFDGEKYSLHALNPLHPPRPLLDDARIAGVAMQVQIPIVNPLRGAAHASA